MLVLRELNQLISEQRDKMKKTVTAAMVAMMIVGCSGGGDTTVQPSDAVVSVEVAPVEVTIEPTPVEVVIINEEPEALPTDLFAGVRAGYQMNEDKLTTVVTMLDNADINLFNFLFVIELEDGDIFYSEPNTEREDGRITVRDTFVFKEGGRYTISLFYYGIDQVQITKHQLDI